MVLGITKRYLRFELIARYKFFIMKLKFSFSVTFSTSEFAKTHASWGLPGHLISTSVNLPLQSQITWTFIVYFFLYES